MDRRVRTAGAALVGGAALLTERRLRRREATPAGTQQPPLAAVGSERIPLLGLAARYRNIIFDPVGLVERSRARHGPVFTVRVPGFFDLTYITDAEGYEVVTRQPASTVRFGEVLADVPVVGIGFPRAGDGTSTLQDLLVATRKLLANRIAGAGRGRAGERVADAIDRLPRGDHDLHVALPRIFGGEACRAIAGDDLWSRHGEALLEPLLVAAHGIDIPRAARTIIGGRLSPERKAADRLHAAITSIITDHDHEHRCTLVDDVRALEVGGRQIDDGDVAWMIMYVLWNAVTYPSTYGFWAVLDVLDRPELSARIRQSSADEAFALAQQCALETIRVHPLSSLPRYLPDDLELDHGGTRWFLPAGSRVAAFPYEALGSSTSPYDPDAHDPAVPLFGRGAYSCVAARFSQDLLASGILAATHTLRGPIGRPAGEARRCRVHLVHPVRPAIARRTAAALPNGLIPLAGVHTVTPRSIECPAHPGPTGASRPGLRSVPTDAGVAAPASCPTHHGSGPILGLR